jgi:transcriptional regulator with XRE-family HTH domain
MCVLRIRKGIKDKGVCALATLAQLRFRRFLTQKALAEQIGVHHRVVSSWESGRNRPSMDHLRALCEYFGVGPEEIDFPLKIPAGDDPARTPVLR